MLFRIVGQILSAVLRCLASLGRIEDSISALAQEQARQSIVLEEILTAVAPDAHDIEAKQQQQIDDLSARLHLANSKLKGALPKS